jgi:flavorubredoxin
MKEDSFAFDPGGPMTRIDEVTGGIYRISTMPKDSPIGFNQFLIDDEHPALIHTGMAPMYEDVRKAIKQVLDPARLAYVILLHFEGDECGGMERFMAEAPEAQLVGCELSAYLNLNSFDFACQGRVLGKRDGQAIDLGRHTLRFLETPHVHHWDSMMLWEEKTRSLFPSDLFIQPGDQPPVIRENLSAAMCELYRHAGIFAHEDPVRRVVDRVERLQPEWVHAMHGGTLTAQIFPRFVSALREQPFAFRGEVLGRAIVPQQVVA